MLVRYDDVEIVKRKNAEKKRPFESDESLPTDSIYRAATVGLYETAERFLSFATSCFPWQERLNVPLMATIKYDGYAFRASPTR